MKIVSLWKILNYAYGLCIKKDPVIISHRKWIKDKGENLRFTYNLSENSVVFDLGGYQGDWSAVIYEKYKCNVFIFEPVVNFYRNMYKRFFNIDKIKVFNFGLSNSNKETKISINKDGSSAVHDWNTAFENIKLVDMIEFVQEHKIEKIDLIKINIEGGEYDILSRLIDSGYIKNCINLQIQFHTYVENATNLREQIRLKLSVTHHLTYDYPWMWENWKLN